MDDVFLRETIDRFIETLEGFSFPKAMTFAFIDMINVGREHGRVKVDPEILLKHLQQSNFDFKGRIRILSDEHEKPGTRGLKTVLMDQEMDENPSSRQSVLWVGDNHRKDIGLGKRLGVRTGWAEYGLPTGDLLQRLAAFSPLDSIHKNAALPTNEPPPSPNYTLTEFAEVLDILG